MMQFYPIGRASFRGAARREAGVKNYFAPMAATLHHRKALGETLTEGEEALVGRFYAAVEAEESKRLQPARERQERRIAEMDAQIHDMQALLVEGFRGIYGL